MNGKGSQRRKENYKLISQNWEEINWNSDLVICSECGQPRNKLDAEKYMVYDGKYWTCKKCNHN